MSLSDCEKCWDTPCSCGWDFRNKPIKDMVFLINGYLKSSGYNKQEFINRLESEAGDERN